MQNGRVFMMKITGAVMKNKISPIIDNISATFAEMNVKQSNNYKLVM